MHFSQAPHTPTLLPLITGTVSPQIPAPIVPCPTWSLHFIPHCVFLQVEEASNKKRSRLCDAEDIKPQNIIEEARKVLYSINISLSRWNRLKSCVFLSQVWPWISFVVVVFSIEEEHIILMRFNMAVMSAMSL